MQKMNDSTNAKATNNLYSNMMRWQFLATLAVAVIAYLVGKEHAFLSAGAGGFCVLTGAFVASKVAARSAGNLDPSTILINLLKAEGIKLLVIALLVFLVFKLYIQLVPAALIAGLAAAALFSGAALAKINEPI